MELADYILVLDFFGSVLIAYAALRVHHRFLNEHQVDEAVFSIMKREQKVGLVGILFITTSFLLEIILL